MGKLLTIALAALIAASLSGGIITTSAADFAQSAAHKRAAQLDQL